MSIIKNNKNINSDILENIITIIKNKVKIPMNNVKETGKYPVISQDRSFIAGYTDVDSFIASSKSDPVILFGDHTTEVKFIDFDFCSGGDGTQIFRTKKDVDIMYLYYLMKNNFIKQDGYKRHFKDLKEKLVSYPNKEEQIKISNFLFNNNLKITNIKNIIEKIEIRNKYYAKKLTSGKILLNNNVEIIEYVFEDIINEHKKSKVMAGDSLKIGLYPFFNCSKKQTLYSNEYLIDDSVLLLSTGGNPSVNYYNGKLSYSTDVWCLNSKYAKYLYYFYNANIEKIEQCFQGGGLQHLSKKDFKKIEIKIPNNDKDIQDIVDYLDRLNEEKEKIEKLLHLEKQRFEWLSDKLLSGEYIIED